MKLRRLFVLALLSLLLLSGCDSLAPTPDSLLAAKERAGITGSLSLYGRIVDDENMPISGVEVEVRAMGFSGTFVSFTDESGYYMFSHEQFKTENLGEIRLQKQGYSSKKVEMIPLFKESSSRKDYILSKNGYIAANTPVAIIELDYKSSKLSSAITFSQEINQSQVLKSPGIERLNMGYLFDENTLANENNVSVKFVDNYKTMILYFPLDVGSSYYSGKSDGSYDLTVDGMGKEEFLELMRKSGDKAKEYIKWAKEKGILIIGLYISDRSIDSKAVYNGIINGVASECDFLIVTDDANNEDTFANISKNKNIPIQIISSGLGSTNKYLIEALKSIFVNE